MPSKAYHTGSHITKWLVEQGADLSGESAKTIEAIAKALAGGEAGIKIAEMLAKQIAAEALVNELKTLESEAVEALRNLFRAAGLPVLF